MARIQFTSEVDEILGRLAGSVFQDSYGGYQVRGLNTPRNPQTQLQQLRRGDFRFLAAGWRNLTSLEKQTWIDATDTVPEALRLYIGNNINLILVGIPIVSSYIPGGPPGSFPLQINSLQPTTFVIQAADEPTIVPDGQRLLLYATADKFPTRLFNNRSEYEPIEFFLPGEDLATPTDVITAWTSKYGVLRINRRICIKSVLIDESNGNRGEESIVCAISNVMERFGIEDNTGIQDRVFDFDDYSFSLGSTTDALNIWEMTFASADELAFSYFDIQKEQIDFQMINHDSQNVELFNMSDGIIQMNVTPGAGGDTSTLVLTTNIVGMTATNIVMGGIQEYADNAAAIAAGLTEGMIYRTGDVMKITHDV